MTAGAYGLRVAGLADAERLLNPCPDTWAGWAVERRAGGAAGTPVTAIGRDSAVLPLLPAGRATIDRATATAVYETPEPLSDDALVHPYLAPIAAVAATWAGRPSFHGGAFAADGGAWVVLADTEAGKSSLMGDLALRGVPVLADDLIVLDGGSVLAGPRCIDLREDVAAELGAGEPLGVLGGRARWRIRLGAVAAETPLRGFVALDWADSDRLEPCSPTEAMRVLASQRAVERADDRLESLLALCELPMLRLARRRQLTGLRAATDLLLDALPSG